MKNVHELEGAPLIEWVRNPTGLSGGTVVVENAAQKNCIYTAKHAFLGPYFFCIP